MGEVIVLGKSDCPATNSILPYFVNTTSISDSFGRSLSPFFLGPVKLYDGAICEYAGNVENAWQYAKCYKKHVGEDGLPSPEYYEWAKNGFEKKIAVRYPMGKGAKPEYHWWAGQKLGIPDSRRLIYIEKYAAAVRDTEAYQELKALYRRYGRVLLWCFDGYNHKSLGMTYDDVINNQERSMGHSFVLGMMLEGLV